MVVVLNFQHIQYKLFVQGLVPISEIGDVVIEASEAIIESGEFAVIDADNFAKSFSKDAKCAINKLFEIAASDTDNNGINGLHYIYNEGNYGDVNALDNVANLFEAGDVRGSDEMLAVDGDDYLRNIGKYPEEDYTNNIALFRYEEVVLNYAEALLATDPATSLIYLNMIPAKRGATAYHGSYFRQYSFGET